MNIISLSHPPLKQYYISVILRGKTHSLASWLTYLSEYWAAFFSKRYVTIFGSSMIIILWNNILTVIIGPGRWLFARIKFYHYKWLTILLTVLGKIEPESSRLTNLGSVSARKQFFQRGRTSRAHPNKILPRGPGGRGTEDEGRYQKQAPTNVAPIRKLAMRVEVIE